jgi:UDP-GlcNAc:undecaprenyl-phosphate/decaprenyl-phosphate GlcNAc-1-phosphate transferase
MISTVCFFHEKEFPLARKIAWQSFLGLFLVFLIHPKIRWLYFEAGLRWQYILVLSFVSAYFLTPLFRLLALKWSILDRPNARKIHDNPTPLLGGAALYVAFTSAILLNGIFLPGMKMLLLGGTLIFVMGLIDDVSPLPAVLKLSIQILIALLVILLGNLQITSFGGPARENPISILLTMLWIVGLTNAMNFFDGIDGLASAVSIIAAFFLGILAFNTDQPALGWFAVALLGSCAGFMPHNFRFGKSALLFLGDAGSTFLGFMLAGLAVMGTWSKSSHFVSLASPTLIFGVLIFDMTYVNLSRIKNGQAKSFSQLLNCVNKDHLHHRLLFLGFARKEVVFIISTLCVCFGVSALIIMRQEVVEALLGLFQALLIIGLIVTFMLKGRERVPKEGERRVMQRRREDRIPRQDI